MLGSRNTAMKMGLNIKQHFIKKTPWGNARQADTKTPSHLLWTSFLSPALIQFLKKLRDKVFL
jgi:hypothetical protein